MPSPGLPITPQPEPTSPRIKKLLSRALIRPETLTPAEVQEMAASVVYYLLTSKTASTTAPPPPP
ncbi:protein of unknown function [Beijerinckiaceae bacterium RH AL1]|jgi:hypothetical protein|nr:hypothetical protein [Beijerinckiaceae bacterium]VVB48505.1 protein of unknown function [Beijerinckiaceae bacterium RH CH11]VVB48586.1 protein of unknown function [Beijerinckiaceae bacterium RH AL8]VVC56428.1 protein of unknown function [Beijerinckiaceae bacterium RH AL1]